MVARAKQPPDKETCDEALVVLDLVESEWFATERAWQEANHTTAGDEFEIRARVWMGRCDWRDRLVDQAVAEYLRRFPRARTKRGNVWVTSIARVGEPGSWLREVDYACLFCRTSLNTLPLAGGTLPSAFVEKLNRHGQACALRFLAGLIPGKGPSTNRRKARRRP